MSSQIFPVYDVNGAPLSGIVADLAWVEYVDPDGNDLTPQPAFSAVNIGFYKFTPSAQDRAIGVVGKIDCGVNANPRYQDVLIEATGEIISSDTTTYADEGIDERAEVVLTNTLANSPQIEDSLVFYLKDKGAPVTPDAATAYVTIVDPGGTKLVDRTPATINAGGKLSYSRVWLESAFPLYEDYCAIWEWEVSGVAFADRLYFDCVRQRLKCLIDTSDLQEVLPNVLDHLKAIGETDCSKFIRRAWSQLLDKIRAGRNRPSLILEKERLINPALHLAMAKTANALKRAPDDIWAERERDEMKQWDEAWAGLATLKYDIDEDGRSGEIERTRVNRKRFFV